MYVLLGYIFVGFTSFGLGLIIGNRELVRQKQELEDRILKAGKEMDKLGEDLSVPHYERLEKISDRLRGVITFNEL